MRYRIEASVTLLIDADDATDALMEADERLARKADAYNVFIDECEADEYEEDYEE